jgi:hypothetical protein
VEVPDLEEAMAKVAGSGGEVLSEIMTVPGVGRFARCRDPEGNVFGIMEMDEAAR